MIAALLTALVVGYVAGCVVTARVARAQRADSELAALRAYRAEVIFQETRAQRMARRWGPA